MCEHEILKLDKIKYYPLVGYYHPNGMPEEIKQFVMSVPHTYWGKDMNKCDCCGHDVYIYSPDLDGQSLKKYATLVLGSIDFEGDEEEEDYIRYLIEEEHKSWALYLCHACGDWSVDERWYG